MFTEEDIKIIEINKKIQEQEDSIQTLKKERMKIKQQRKEHLLAQSVEMKDEILQELNDKYIEPLRHITGKCYKGNCTMVNPLSMNFDIDGVNDSVRYQEEVFKFRINGIKNLNEIEEIIDNIHQYCISKFDKPITLKNVVDEIENHNMWVIFDVSYISSEMMKYDDKVFFNDFHLKNIFKIPLISFYNRLEEIEEQEFNEWREEIMKRIKKL